MLLLWCSKVVAGAPQTDRQTDRQTNLRGQLRILHPQHARIVPCFLQLGLRGMGKQRRRWLRVCVCGSSSSSSSSAVLAKPLALPPQARAHPTSKQAALIHLCPRQPPLRLVSALARLARSARPPLVLPAGLLQQRAQRLHLPLCILQLGREDRDLQGRQVATAMYTSAVRRCNTDVVPMCKPRDL
jgi:hypothetical protein